MAMLLSSRVPMCQAQQRRMCHSSQLLPRVPLARPRQTASSDEAETAKVTVVDADATSYEEPAEPIVSEEVIVTEAQPVADVTSHPLPDMFGAQELLSELQDQDQFGKRGEVWTFAQIAVVMLVLLPPFQLTGLVDILATLVITAGVVFIVYGLMSLRRYVSPLPAPRANHELVTSGMYSYIRHPMYGGLLMAAFGLAIITRNETRLAMAVLLWVVLEKKVGIEEKMLLERYGKLYEDYKAKVKKRFFPFVY